MRTKVLVVIMTLFAGMASAQRRSSGGGGIKSAGTTKPSAVKASAARTAKPAANGTTQKSGQVKPTVVRQKITTAPSTSTRTGIMRTTAPAASASRTVVEYGHPSHSTWSRFWWGGGPYFGTWYRPGWYYPWAVYPSYWYWNGWSGYRFEYESRPADASGIKFDLGQIKAKADRKAIEEAGYTSPTIREGKDTTAQWKAFLNGSSRLTRGIMMSRLPWRMPAKST